MKEQLISIETAKLGKEKGFDWEVQTYYDNKSKRLKKVRGYEDWNTEDDGLGFKPYSAPTQSLLQKWLRENPKLILWCIPIGTDYEDFVVWNYKIRNHTNGREHTGKLQLKTYEEALEKGLQEALKLI